jgi:stearoyl-CoA desaturase (delta-9 desaturase)
VPPEQTGDRWLRFLERTWFLHPLAAFALVALVFDVHVAATVVLCRVAITILGHWFVGYVSHTWGETRWELDGSSEIGRNNLLLGWLSFGEGFHNNHHAHPGSARMGFRWHELDLGWLAVRALAALGLIREVQAFGTHETRRRNARARGVSDPSRTLRWNVSTWRVRWSRWIGGHTSSRRYGMDGAPRSRHRSASRLSPSGHR